jgi:hypothetical protein
MSYYIEHPVRGKLLGKFMGQCYFEKDILEGSCLTASAPLAWDKEDVAENLLKTDPYFKMVDKCYVTEEEDSEEDEDDTEEDTQDHSIAHRLISLLFYIMGGLGVIIGLWVLDGCKPISIHVDIPGLHVVVDEVPRLK